METIMHHITNLSFAILSLAIMAISIIIQPADLYAGRYKIKCDRQYQLVQGSWISTPPCEEAYIAKVARSYGYKVTTRQIRNNPNKKISICLQLGHDTRIKEICGAYSNQYPSAGRR